jgi:hypothetical protein
MAQSTLIYLILLLRKAITADIKTIEPAIINIYVTLINSPKIPADILAIGMIKTDRLVMSPINRPLRLGGAPDITMVEILTAPRVIPNNCIVDKKMVKKTDSEIPTPIIQMEDNPHPMEMSFPAPTFLSKKPIDNPAEIDPITPAA